LSSWKYPGALGAWGVEWLLCMCFWRLFVPIMGICSLRPVEPLQSSIPLPSPSLHGGWLAKHITQRIQSGSCQRSLRAVTQQLPHNIPHPRWQGKVVDQFLRGALHCLRIERANICLKWNPNSVDSDPVNFEATYFTSTWSPNLIWNVFQQTTHWTK
jgi:hypothetical protein